MVPRANSTPWSKNSRPRCASTSKLMEHAHFTNTANSLTDQKSLDSQMTHSQSNSARPPSALSIPTIKLSLANTWRKQENANSEMAALSITMTRKEDSSSTHSQTYQKASLYHQCQKDHKATDQRTRSTAETTPTMTNSPQATKCHHNQWSNFPASLTSSLLVASTQTSTWVQAQPPATLHNHSSVNSEDSKDHHIWWPNLFLSLDNQTPDHSNSTHKVRNKRTTTRKTAKNHLPKTLRDMKRRTKTPPRKTRLQLKRSTAQRNSQPQHLRPLPSKRTEATSRGHE